MSRPQALNESIIKRICDRLIEGDSMLKICESPDMPSKSTIYLAMANDEAFRTIIARAREAQQEAVIDSTIDLADSATPETVNVVKLQIWARQWRAGKLAPKKYSEKLNINADVSTVSMTHEQWLESLK